MAPRYTGSKIYNRLNYCQTKFWFTFSRFKIFGGMTVGVEHYLVNGKILFLQENQCK